MHIENRCEGCKFYKKHSLFTEKGVESLGATCLITNKDTRCIVGNKIITFDLQQQCPLQKISQYDKWNKCWRELRAFVIKLEEESFRVKGECDRLLREIMFKIKDLEKGE